MPNFNSSFLNIVNGLVMIYVGYGLFRAGITGNFSLSKTWLICAAIAAACWTMTGALWGYLIALVLFLFACLSIIVRVLNTRRGNSSKPDRI